MDGKGVERKGFLTRVQGFSWGGANCERVSPPDGVFVCSYQRYDCLPITEYEQEFYTQEGATYKHSIESEACTHAD